MHGTVGLAHFVVVQKRARRQSGTLLVYKLDKFAQKDIMENGHLRYDYDTLSEAVNDLQKRGYTRDFLITEATGNIHCKKPILELPANEFVIDEVYRFEGMTDPADESIVFAISSVKTDVKGLVINAFGAGFGSRSSKLVEDLFFKPTGTGI